MTDPVFRQFSENSGRLESGPDGGGLVLLVLGAIAGALLMSFLALFSLGSGWFPILGAYVLGGIIGTTIVVSILLVRHFNSGNSPWIGSVISESEEVART